MELDVRVRKRKEGVFVVEIVGSIDSTSYEELENKLKPLLTASTKVVVLDMTGVDYVSSSGFSVIYRAKTSIEKSGGALVMTNLQSHIKKVFDIMKVLSGMAVLPSMDDADVFLSNAKKRENKKKQ